MSKEGSSVNTLRLLAEDLHSSQGFNEYSVAMSKAADTLDRHQLGIRALENEVRKSHATIGAQSETIAGLRAEVASLKREYENAYEIVNRLREAEARAVQLVTEGEKWGRAQALQGAYQLGFRRCVEWTGDRDDLLSDIGSPAYLKDMANDLMLDAAPQAPQGSEINGPL